MKAWKLAAVTTVAIITALGIFLVSAYSPMTINFTRLPAGMLGDQQYFQWVVTGHLPGQSMKTFQFAVREYVSGSEVRGYGSGTNDSLIQTDIFGNFQISDPQSAGPVPANFTISIILVSSDGIVIEKTMNVPEG